MCRRGENIYKRKDGRWEGRYFSGRKENGQIKYGYIYGYSYKEVQKKLFSCKVDYQNRVEELGEDVTLFKEFVVNWLFIKKKEIKESTYASYSYKISRYILPSLGNYSLNCCTEQKIQNVIIEWQKNALSPSTMKVLLRILNQCLSYAVSQGLIKKNACKAVTLPKKDYPRIRSLSVSEQKALESVAKKDQSIYGQAIIFSLRTGLRIGEISALKWSSVDFNVNVIRVEHTLQRIQTKDRYAKTKVSLDITKTNASKRVIPMSSQVRTLLLNIKRESVSSFIFTNTSSFCEPRLLTYHFHRIRKQVNLENIHFHQLRHTFATRCLEVHSDITSVSALLGHSSTQMTLDVYADSFLEQRKKILRLMEEKIA